MAINLNNFLHSLALAMATASSLAYETTPRSLWRNQAIEDAAADPYSVLRIYGGGPLVWHPLPIISVQCLTSGGGNDAVLSQAQKLFESLLESDGRPAQGRIITGKTVAGASDGTWRIVWIQIINRPGLIGRTEKGQAQAAFNFDCGFHRQT